MIHWVGMTISVSQGEERSRGVLETGQFPKSQVIVPSDLVEILIAHDVVRLGLAYTVTAAGSRPGAGKR